MAGPVNPGWGRHDKIAASLTHYLERRLLDTACQDHQRSFPRGYMLEFHTQTHCQVLRHEASGCRCCCTPLDLLERVDRGQRAEPAVLAYIYFSEADIFARVTKLANREPRKAWKILVEARVLTLVEERADGVWYNAPATCAEPAKASAEQGLPAEWRAAPFCIALYMPAHECRSSLSGTAAAGSSVVDVWLPGGAPREASAGVWVWPPMVDRAPQIERGLMLVEAAARRDAEAVRQVLEARADPDFQDNRGWTALHAACAVTVRWEVLDQLLEVCDVTARTNAGLLPCDLADMGNHEDTARVVKECMQQHNKGKHLPAASSTLTAAAKAALGLTHVDYTAAAKVGKRRTQGEEEEMLREFSNLLMSKYKNADAAFRAFDFNSNGTLSAAEFTQSAQQLRFSGDPGAVFKAIDLDREGDISKVEFRTLQRLYDQEQMKKKSGSE